LILSNSFARQKEGMTRTRKSCKVDYSTKVNKIGIL
jgi:hypothetical protein